MHSVQEGLKFNLLETLIPNDSDLPSIELISNKLEHQFV